MKDIPLAKRIAAAVYATQEEKYELLEEIKKQTAKDHPEEEAYFWELVNIFLNNTKRPDDK